MNHDYTAMVSDPFSRVGLSLDRLRSFLTVAEAGGIARAAPRDPTRQSQLSRQISELETFFGTALVERRGRSVALTPAGERLAIVVRETIDGIRDVAATAQTTTLSLSLGAGDSVLHGWVLPHVGRALTEAPGTTLRLVALSGPDVAAQLLDARLDFGIVRAKDVALGLRSRAIGTIGYALYVPQKLRPKSRARSDAELVAGLPLATQHGDPELAERLRTAVARAGETLVPRLVCETFTQAERAMRSGHFAAVLPLLDDPPADTDIVHSPLFGPPLKVHLAWHARLERRRPRAAAMIDTLLRAFLRVGGAASRR